MTGARRVARDWGTIIAIGLLTVGILILFALLIPALGTISQQATAGQQAKRRQCVIAPVSLKVYRHERAQHVITAADLALYKRTAPRGCRAALKTPK